MNRIGKITRNLVLLSLILSVLITPIDATVVNITSSGDTWIDETKPTTSHGGDIHMFVGSNASSGALGNSLIIFNLSSIPNGSTINSATLYLYELSGGNVGHIQSLYNITSSWNESTVIWDTKPTHQEPSFTYANGIASVGWYSWGVKDTVQAWVNGNLANNGFLLNETSGNPNYLMYCTRECGTTIEDPYISIDYTPPIDKKGDVNQDSVVNIVDALFIAQYTVETRTLTATQLTVADVNGDGQVNIVDALFIAQNTVGLRQL